MNQHGTGLISAIIATALIGFLMLGLVRFVSVHQTLEVGVNARLSAAILRANAITVLRNETAWSNTLADSAKCNHSSLKCLSKGISCESAIGRENSISCIYDANGNVLFDEKNKKAGLTEMGVSCEPLGSPGCNFRPEFSWRIECAAAPCTGKPIVLEVKFTYRNSVNSTLRLDRFAAVVRR